MTPLFFIFLPLCVIFNGEQNCDYKWTQIQDREIFESTYRSYGVIELEQPQRVGAFGVTSEKKVFFHNTSIEAILHEIDHIYCDLGKSENRDVCHVELHKNFG